MPTILHNQSLLDFSVQHTGTVDNAFSIAIANGKSPSDLLKPGESYEIPEELEKDNDILNYYQAKKIQPATGNIEEFETTGKGIGWMRIGSTFKVAKG